MPIYILISHVHNSDCVPIKEWMLFLCKERGVKPWQHLVQGKKINRSGTLGGERGEGGLGACSHRIIIVFLHPEIFRPEIIPKIQVCKDLKGGGGGEGSARGGANAASLPTTPKCGL